MKTFDTIGLQAAAESIIARAEQFAKSEREIKAANVQVGAVVGGEGGGRSWG